MVFTGVMDYRPNIDAVVWFCNEILPMVQTEIPGANFTICGSRPAPVVRRLVKRRGVTVTGWVPDARPYLDRAEVFVAPLRMARGVQNKLLEALAMGLPCVASTAARSGTVVADRQGILATDEPIEFARYVIDLLRVRAAGGDGAPGPCSGGGELPLGAAVGAPRSGYCRGGIPTTAAEGGGSDMFPLLPVGRREGWASG